ncbi:putative integral membrane protein [Babesia bovis T2Bo]|uniref:putative integral membrane protein n=1 Tax=Babesia bovis T2Bo TaxID=484906 RepID=UPI001C349E77|nr:putative integral membrane protein [Babesia bovis T2Bo]EDO05289.2 putative integral membrane protein [Babesia bovis T2Bo]
MCVTVKRYFQVPWHVQDARVIDVLTLVCYPLVSSLMALAVSLNVMVFMQMYTSIIPHWYITMSYCSCVSATLSFILFVLSTIYGRSICAALGYICFEAFFIQQVPLSIELLLEPGLEAQMDPPVLMMMRATVIFFDIVVLWMGIRLALVIIALTEAMMRGGMLWDLDDAKERHFGDHPRNYSISVPEDES